MASPAIFKSTKTQLLTQEGIKLKNGADKDILVGTDDPRVVAKDADAGSLYLIDGSNLVFRKIDNGLTTNWLPFGDTKSLDIIYQENFDGIRAADFSTGNNATFLGGGSLAGTLADDTVTPFSGVSTLVYTQAAGSLNDYYASPVINIEEKVAGNDLAVTLYLTYDGESQDIVFRGYDDVTGVISSDLDLIENPSDPTRFAVSIPVTAGATQLQWGFQVVTLNSGAILKVDSVEMSLDNFVTGKTIDRVTATGAGNGGTSITVNVTDIDFTETSDTGGAFDGTVYTVQYKNALISIEGSLRFTSTTSRQPEIYRNGSFYKVAGSNVSVNGQKFSFQDSTLDPGDELTVRVRTTGGTLSNDPEAHWISIAEDKVADAVITPATSNISNLVEYTPVLQGITPSDASFYYTRRGSLLRINGFLRASAVDGNQVRFGLPIVDGTQLTVSSSLGSGVGSTFFTVGFGVRSSGSPYFNMLADENNSFIGFSFSSSGSPLSPETGTSSLSPGEYFTFFAEVEVNEWDSVSDILAAIPYQKVAYLEDVKSSGTGGTFTSGAWQTRDLNTISGDSEIVSLSANQFTLAKGQYQIVATAPAQYVGGHQAKLRNITTGSDAKLGSSEHAQPTGPSVTTRSVILANLTLTSTQTFEIQHRSLATKATNGFGLSVGLGDEIFTQVTITKLR